MANDTISIVIPCLNEASTIEEVVVRAKKALRKNGFSSSEVIVADNGSTDGSIENVLKQKIARLVKVPVRGYGAALHWGIMAARSKYVFFADADLSYDFSEIKLFVPFVQRDYDLVLGSRLRGRIMKSAMPFLNRYLGTPLLTFLIRVMYRISVSDCNSGMRMVKRSFYKRLNMRNSGMEWASELILKTAISEGKYGEVPIKFYKDKRGVKPHLLRWTDGWRHLKAIILIRPNYLFIPVAILGFFTVYFSGRSFDLTYFFGLLGGAMFLSVLAAKMLNYAVDNRRSRVIGIINKLPVVRIAAVLTTLAFVLLFIITEKHQGTKLAIISSVVIFDIWVFLIETIKTHLVNKLPDVK